jgi:tetratricopeptide (TPR) repeat protein
MTMGNRRSLGMHAGIAVLFLVHGAFCAEKDEQRSLPALQEYVQAHPSDTATRLQLARALALSKKYEQANTQYAAVLAQEPGNLAAKVGLAKVASWQGDLDRSLTLYDEALRRSPHLYDAVVGKGFTLAWMGKSEEALDILRRAAKMHPDDDEVASEVKRLSALVPKNDQSESPKRTSTVRKKSVKAEGAAAASALQPQAFPEPIAPAKALAPERTVNPLWWVLPFFGVLVAAMVAHLRRSRPPQEQTSEKTAAGPAPKRVLVVEANDEAASFVKMLFAQLGAEVERLPDVNKLFITHRRKPADLVLVDGDCGRGLLDEVIETGLARGASVVFACSTIAESQVIHEAGFRSIRKPFRVVDLASLLDDASSGAIPGPAGGKAERHAALRP